MGIKGIDVSHWQRSIDWNAVKSVCDFAFIKATGGDNGLYLDSMSYKNYRAAKNSGVTVGQYHFAGGGDPTEEAHYFIAKVSPLEENDVLILDWEIGHIDPVSWCKTFCDVVFESTGVHPIIYMSQSVTTNFDWSSVAKDCGLWVAKYGVNNGTEAGAGNIGSTGAFSCIAWQYTSKGSCVGISGNVDLDIFYGSVEQLKKYGWHSPQPVIPQIPVETPVVEPAQTPVMPIPETVQPTPETVQTPPVESVLPETPPTGDVKEIPDAVYIGATDVNKPSLIKIMEGDIVKIGVKTSEFWLGLLTAVLTYMNSALGWKVPTDQVVAILTMVLGYIASRTYLKSQSK